MTPASGVAPSNASGAGAEQSAQSRYGNGFLAERLAERNGGGPAPAPGVDGAGVDAGQVSQAVGGSPLKVSNPLPVKAGEQKREVLGVQIIGRDVSPSALDGCEAFVKLTLGQRPDIQKRMKSANVALVIIPRDRKMTDVAQFASLKGTKTFDGRVWDDVRGSGGMKVAGGLWAIGVPEENLVAASPDNDGYGAGYSVGMHELSHTIHSKGVSDDERKKITELYAARKKAGGPWTESYGASNEQEYYAQSTNCYFGENKGIGQNGARWLLDNDKAMYDFLVTIYGPPPGRATVATSQPGGRPAPGGDTAHA